MELEQRVDVLEEKMTTMQIKVAAQDVSNAHTAALLEKLSRAVDRLVESRLATPPIEPILLELNKNLAQLNDKIEQPEKDSKKNSSPILEFIAQNPKKFYGIVTAFGGGCLWLVHHIVIISAI